MIPVLEQLNLRDAVAVERALYDGADSNLRARCRRGSIDRINIAEMPKGTPGAGLIAAGDLHDQPVHLLRLLDAAGILKDQEETQGADSARSDVKHIVLHELIHSDRLINGMDFSYRMLVRAAVLKTTYPERVHTLLANHEIAQCFGHRVAKEGVDCNGVFLEALESVFGANAARVEMALKGFIRSMPLAARFVTPAAGDLGGDLLIAHSLPPEELMERFDLDILNRELVDEDFIPRRGSAHIMTWGRGHSPEHVEALAKRWNVRTFVLGHEKADDGYILVSPRALVLNSDHEKGVYVPIDLHAGGAAWNAERLARASVPLASAI